MKYAILGSGAMGLRFGILLQQAGYPVDFIDTWKPEINTIRKQHGVYVSRDGKGRHLVKTNIYTPEEYHGDPDILMMETKQMDLAEMLKRCAHFFKSHQYAVTLMNGMGHIPKIDKYFPKKHVIAGTALVASVLNKAGDDDFIGAPDSGSCNLANQTEKPDATTKELLKEFGQAHLHPHYTTNFMGMLMSKLILNSVVNTLCTAFQCQMGQFISSPAAKPITIALLNEAFDVCERAGIRLLGTRQKEWAIIHHNAKYEIPKHYPSMCQDMFKGRRTEVDYINGYFYRLGLKYHNIAHAHHFAIQLVHLAETLHQLRNK